MRLNPERRAILAYMLLDPEREYSTAELAQGTGLAGTTIQKVTWSLGREKVIAKRVTGGNHGMWRLPDADAVSDLLRVRGVAFNEQHLAKLPEIIEAYFKRANPTGRTEFPFVFDQIVADAAQRPDGETIHASRMSLKSAGVTPSTLGALLGVYVSASMAHWRSLGAVFDPQVRWLARCIDACWEIDQNVPVTCRKWLASELPDGRRVIVALLEAMPAP